MGVHRRHTVVVRCGICLVLLVKNHEIIAANIGSKTERPLISDGQIPGVLEPGHKLARGLVEPGLADHPMVLRDQDSGQYPEDHEYDKQIEEGETELDAPDRASFSSQTG